MRAYAPVERHFPRILAQLGFVLGMTVVRIDESMYPVDVELRAKLWAIRVVKGVNEAAHNVFGV